MQKISSLFIIVRLECRSITHLQHWRRGSGVIVDGDLIVTGKVRNLRQWVTSDGDIFRTGDSSEMSLGDRACTKAPGIAGILVEVVSCIDVYQHLDE